MPRGKTRSISILKKLKTYALQAPVTLLFIAIPVIIAGIALVKLASGETRQVYTKVKVSQGFWWATTSKPNIWLAEAIKKGGAEYSLLGKPVAEILEVRYYPYFSETSTSEDKFNIFLKVRIAADYNKRTQQYTFKRSTLSVGAPIELETSTAQITGTITEVSEKEFEDKYTEKIVTLTKKFAYPWEYDAIQVGDKYFDGEEMVFTVLDKRQVGTAIITSDFYGNFNPSTTDSTRYLVVEAEIKVKVEGDRLIYAEETLLNRGAILPISTPNYHFEDFIVGKIE